MTHLVVAGDDDDADTCASTFLDGVYDLCPGRVQHTHDAHEGAVGFVLDELAAVLQVHVLLLGWVVNGGQGEATQCVASCNQHLSC